MEARSCRSSLNKSGRTLQARGYPGLSCLSPTKDGSLRFLAGPRGAPLRARRLPSFCVRLLLRPKAS
eukprot:14394479-Alexandrium_andersonii.AAC.1